MTRFQKILAVLATALLLAPAAGFAQTKSLDDLLKEVRAGRRADSELFDSSNTRPSRFA